MAAPSVLGERQGQGGLEGGLLVDAVVLEDRERSWAGGAGASQGDPPALVQSPHTDRLCRVWSPRPPLAPHGPGVPGAVW